MAYEGLPPFTQGGWSKSRVPPKYRWAWDGLYVAIPGQDAGGVVDIVNNIVGTPIGSVTSTTSYQGPELTFAASTYISFGDQIQFGIPLHGSVTIAAIHSPASTAVASMWHRTNSAGGEAPFALIYSFGANSQYSFWNDDNAHGPTSTTTYAVGTRNLIMGRRTGLNISSPTLDLFVNGALKGTTTSTISEPSSLDIGTGQLTCINRFGGFNGYMGNGSISNILVWNRALSDVEIEKFSEDPYGPLRQMRQDYVFMFKAASQSKIPMFSDQYRRRRSI